MADMNGDYADEIAQPSIRHLERPATTRQLKEDFAPWHKPRKHWIRRYQWGLESKRLIETLKIAEKRSLRYLTLPGPDMLDVRLLQKTCEELKTELRYVGYIKPSAEEIVELELSQAEINDLGFIDQKNSRVIHADFQSVANPKSVGAARILNEEAFDVINVDLCKCVGEYAPVDAQKAYFDAIKGLFELQVRHRRVGEPWLFFLTTRVDYERVHADSRQRFFALLSNACRASTSLAGKIQAEVGLSIADIDSFATGIFSGEKSFEKAFGIAICEWVSHLLANFTPQVEVVLLSSTRSYGVRKPGIDDMFALAFRCQTVFVGTSDLSGLTSGGSTGVPQRITEHDSVAEMVGAVGSIKNLDNVFSDEAGYRTITAMALEFMVSARFNGDRYREQCANWPEAPANRVRVP